MSKIKISARYTLIYTHLLDSEEDDKYCTAANNVEEAQMIAMGFE
jgi:hypothetical protein